MKNNQSIDSLNEYKYFSFLFKAPMEMGNRMNKKRYENEEINMILLEIPRYEFEKLSILELGGCLGVVSVISNNLLINKNNHVVIEANPELLPILIHNKKRNNSHFNIENCIISENKTNTNFKAYDKVVAGSAHRMDNREKNERVYSIKNKTLKSLVNKYCLFDCIIMDIEGGELDFLIENSYYIKTNVKYIIIEIHEFLMYKNFEKKCLNILQNECNMVLVKQNGISFLYKNRRF